MLALSNQVKIFLTITKNLTKNKKAVWKMLISQF